MKTFLKVTAIVSLCILIIISSLIFAYLIITKDAVLDRSKLIGSGQHVIILDDEGNEMTSASIEIQKKSVSVGKLNSDTINAFIASEDRNFYKHNGLNYKRMAKALFKNIASRSFKEGASTISQQLIKNTHLSSDKTIKRKLKEIKLTRKLEKKYSKDEILEMYLNTIYFGHNCYGLQSAAEFYFGKKAEDLNLPESATIVGLLSSPNNYSPFKNPEKSLKRRNLVLKSMCDCGYINETAYRDAISSPLNTERQIIQDKYGSYISAVFDELEEIDFNHYMLTDGCKIVTYLNNGAQKCIENLDYPCDNAVIITDNLSGGVKAYKTTIGGVKRQPGSTAKPIFVYAPAIEEKYLSPFTKILDEKVNFNGYTPENYDKKYHGMVTVTDSIKNSYNIPAVKTLNSLTIDKSEKYLTAMDISLDEEERNLSLALGGMKYGLSIKELADKYSIFPRGGKFIPSRFIKEIVSKDGKILYKNNFASSRVFSEGTCSLMNEMLLETSKSGTAKKLKDFKFDVASKTGTCGNNEGNTDAYAVSYTSENCFAVWLGDKDNERTEITGGTDCCKLMQSILQGVYSDRAPAPLDIKSGTISINIDREEYEENNKIIIADPVCPKLNLLSVKVLAGNEPKQISERFTSPTIATPTITVTNNQVKVNLCHAKYYSFTVKRYKNGIRTTIYDGLWQDAIYDTPSEGQYTYTVIPYFKSVDKVFLGKEITLATVNIGKSNSIQNEVPDIVHKNWYDLQKSDFLMKSLFYIFFNLAYIFISTTLPFLYAFFFKIPSQLNPLFLSTR